MRKPTLVVSAVVLLLSALSQADAQPSRGSDIAWTTGMQQYVQDELQDARDGSDGGFWRWFCGFVPAACPGHPGGPGPQDVPEPETLTVFAAGLGLLGFAAYRRRARASSRHG